MSTYDQEYYEMNKGAYIEAHSRYRKQKLKQLNIEVQQDWYRLLQYYCAINDIKISTFIKDSIEQRLATEGFEDLKKWSQAFEENKRGAGIDIEEEIPLLRELKKENE